MFSFLWTPRRFFQTNVYARTSSPYLRIDAASKGNNIATSTFAAHEFAQLCAERCFRTVHRDVRPREIRVSSEIECVFHIRPRRALLQESKSEFHSRCLKQTKVPLVSNSWTKTIALTRQRHRQSRNPFHNPKSNGMHLEKENRKFLPHRRKLPRSRPPLLRMMVSHIGYSYVSREVSDPPWNSVSSRSYHAGCISTSPCRCAFLSQSSADQFLNL